MQEIDKMEDQKEFFKHDTFNRCVKFNYTEGSPLSDRTNDHISVV